MGWNFLVGLNRSKLKSEPIVVSLRITGLTCEGNLCSFLDALT